MKQEVYPGHSAHGFVLQVALEKCKYPLGLLLPVSSLILAQYNLVRLITLEPLFFLRPEASACT